MRGREAGRDRAKRKLWGARGVFCSFLVGDLEMTVAPCRVEGSGITQYGSYLT